MVAAQSQAAYSPSPSLKVPAAAPAIYLFADHLDAALAYAEDLLALSFRQSERAGVQSTREVAAEQHELRQFLSQVRTREMALTLRVLQAHRRVEALLGEFGAADKPMLRHALSLFRTVTDGLVDASGRLADGNIGSLDAGHDVIAFLHARTLINPSAAGLDDNDLVAVTENYPVAGALPLGPLMDVLASTLDILDAAFGLYCDDELPHAAATFAAQKAANHELHRASGDIAGGVTRSGTAPLKSTAQSSDEGIIGMTARQAIAAVDTREDARAELRAQTAVSASDLALAAAIEMATARG